MRQIQGIYILLILCLPAQVEHEGSPPFCNLPKCGNDFHWANVGKGSSSIHLLSLSCLEEVVKDSCIFILFLVVKKWEDILILYGYLLMDGAPQVNTAIPTCRIFGNLRLYHT